MKKGFDFEKTEKKLSGLYSGLLGAAPAVDAVARSRTAPVNKGESRGIFGRPSFQIVSAVLAAVIIGGGAFFGITLLRSQSHGGPADTTVSDTVDTTDKETHRSDTTGGATVPDDKTGKMTISAVFGENQSVLEGDCFDVDVKLENVKELSSLRLTVFWDPELTLVRAEFGDVGGIKDISDSTEPPCSFNWLALEDDAVIRDDTTFLRLSFTVPVSEDHTWKQYNISLSADPENVFDANGENVAFEIRNLSFSSVVPVQSVPETVTGPVSETTGDDTTEPDTTGPAATEPETTEPETTEPETTAPKTTVIATESDTEPPAPDPTVYRPADYDKKGFRLIVNGHDITRTTAFHVGEDGRIILPFSTIFDCLGHGDSKVFSDNYIHIGYEGTPGFRVDATRYRVTSTLFEGNWLDGRITEESVLFLYGTARTNGVLYADAFIINAFLKEFAGGCVSVNSADKTIDVRDAHYEEEKPVSLPDESDRHELPYADGMFFAKVPGTTIEVDRERYSDYYAIVVYIKAEDDGGRIVPAFSVIAANGARVRIAAAQNEDGTVEIYSWREFLTTDGDGVHTYFACASEDRIVFSAWKTDAASPYSYNVKGKTASLRYTDETKEKLMMQSKNKYQASECEAEAAQIQASASGVSGVTVIYESDGQSESFMKTFDPEDVFTLTVARENGLYY